MVITDNSRDSKSVTTPSSPFSSNSEANTSWMQPPPSYTQPNQGAPPPLSPQGYQPVPLSPHVYLLPVVPQSRPQKSAARRFCKAFAVAFIIYVCLATSVKLLVIVIKPGFEEITGSPAGPTEADGSTSFCYLDPIDSSKLATPLSGYGFSYKSNHSLPISSKYLYFLSRGSYTQGSFNFELSENTGDKVEVNTIIHARTKSAFGHIRVCSLGRDDGGNGVGFFTPEHYRFSPYNIMKFDTTVRFPRPDGNVLNISRLETAMRNWAHEVKDLKGLVKFDSLDFETTNAPIKVESGISMIGALLETTNSGISGTFNTSDHLTLRTRNGPIVAHVNMDNADGDKPTTLELKTRNGRIDSSVSLLRSSSSSFSPSVPPTYSVTAETTNSQLKFNVKDAVISPFSKLDFTGRTTNSRTNIILHPTYEGSILQETTNAAASFDANDNTPDPSGKGRQRSAVAKAVSRKRLETVVWWGDDNQKPNMGKVEIRTTNAKNVVELV